MAYREIMGLSAEERAAHESKWGRYNDFPPGWEEIPEAELARSDFFLYAPDLVEHRQMMGRIDRAPAMSATLYFMPRGHGYAMAADFWGQKVRFFRFGCQHEWGAYTGSEPLYGLSARTCVHCGEHWAFDTSD